MAEKRYSKYWSKTDPLPEPPHIKTGPGNNIYLYEDGSIKATKFVDDNDRDISFAEFNKKKDGVEGFYFEKPLDDATTVQYIPSKTQQIYKTKVTQKVKVKNAFAVIKGKVKRFILQKMDRFLHEDKFRKNEIKKLDKQKATYHFTEVGLGGNHYNKRYIDSTNFGPYNHDIKIKVTESVTQLNDILVVKTGILSNQVLNHGIVPSGERIIFASPHTILIHKESGDYLSTGITNTYTTLTGIYSTGWMWTGTYEYNYHKKHSGVTNSVNNYSVSSSSITIPKNSILKTELYYFNIGDNKHINDYYNTNTLELGQTAFSMEVGTVRTKGKRKHEIMGEGVWDGVIPSGTPFKIETWSTNPKYIGFVGELSIVPTNSSIKCEYETECLAYGMDEIYETSVLKGTKKALQKCHRKLNNYLINKGIKNKNSKMKRFEAMIEKNAQNIYEGLTYIRNEKLQKQRGTDFHPLDSVYYYDGTLEVYGGSKLNANYSYADIATDIAKSKAATINPYSNSEGSSGGTSNMGY